MSLSSAFRVWLLMAAVVGCGRSEAVADERVAVTAHSLAELATFAALNNQVVSMPSGVYRMGDYLTEEIIRQRTSDSLQAAKAIGQKHGDTYMLKFSGNNNVFEMKDVVVEVNSELLSAFKDCYIREFLIEGSSNVFNDLTVKDTGDGRTYCGGNNISIHGDNTVLNNLTLYAHGSSPYGYGDLLGKGGPGLVDLHKHGGVLISGENTQLIGCKVFIRSFGHAFFVQGGINTLFKDCYAEGEIRSTDEMLAETSGLAFETRFRSVYATQQGEKKIAPGYMKALSECGFRTYPSGGPANRKTGHVKAVNCTAENMRVGFAFYGTAPSDNPDVIENCATLGCERGYYLNNAHVENSRGDAKYGPLLHLNGGSNSYIELSLMNAQSTQTVHAIATLSGTGHTVILKKWKNEGRKDSVPIMLGYKSPAGGDNAGIIPEASAQRISIQNMTGMPVEVGPRATDCVIQTDGPVENRGRNITVEKITPDAASD